MQRPAAFYLGVFLITLCTLVHQVVATRIISVLTWYHLAFLSISLAMLGMTAAGLYVYLGAPVPSPQRTRRVLVSHSLWFALSLPLCHVALISLRLPDAVRPWSADLATLALAVGLAGLPFFFAGVVVAVALTETPLPTGRIYGFDLLGAALGCLVAVSLLGVLDPSSTYLAIGSGAAVAALAFSVGVEGRASRPAAGLALLLGALAVANSATYPDLIWVSRMNGMPVPTQNVVLDRWNNHSRVVAWQGEEAAPFFWGPGRTLATGRLPEVRSVSIQIDGAAYTAATRFDGDPKSVGWVRHDVTSLGHQIRGRGAIAVIGVGGGRDLLTAIGFGADRVVGIEVNGILVDLLRERLRGFTRLVDRDDVTLVHDDGRSWMAGTDQRFDLIQMALIDTFASTSAGAMSLTENGLYTREAWNTFLERLNPHGVFALSRYYHPRRISEAARAVSLAVDTLLARGSENPSDHLVLATAGVVSTLLVGRDPLSPADLGRLRAVIEQEGFTPVALPGQPAQDPILLRILEARSAEGLAAATRHPHFDLSASSDDRPFFFNMLKLSAWRSLSDELMGGVVVGNLRATQTLVGLLLVVLLLTAATILGPLLVRGRRHGLETRTFVASTSYFSLIGLGFMLVEIGLIQKFSILLGHPIRSMAITLMSMILATGLGSLASDRIAAAPAWRLAWLPALAALCIAAGALAVQGAIDATMAAPLAVRAAVVVGFTFPIGFSLGAFFPIGLARLRSRSPVVQSWMWGLNGALGVLGSLGSIVIGMTLGIRACLLLGAACYLLLSVPAWHLYRRAEAPVV